MSENEVLKKIDTLIKENQVVLFMKGTPQFPQCGFSQRVSSILSQLNVEYGHVNVLLDPSIREGIKVYSDWPTIPQLYIGQEFVGGCDIITELNESGELAKLLH
ncbi:MAG: Grx4 family monothiol glutaredoxin [Mariprofundaceae bacterium]|nr:Grx4 family monothiol glutaredoxin [Mariprofundaceae bacterium]